MRKLNAGAFWSAKGFALLVIPILIATIFYGYTAVLGRNLFALDIATFVVAVVATQLASAQLFRADIHTRWAHSIGISLLLCQIAVYSIFTYYPPAVSLFEDGRNGTRGIPRSAADTATSLRNVEEMEQYVFAFAKELLVEHRLVFCRWRMIAMRNRRPDAVDPTAAGSFQRKL